MRIIFGVIIIFWLYTQINLTSNANPQPLANKQCSGFMTNYKNHAISIPESKLPLVFYPNNNIPKDWYDDIEIAMEYINVVAKRDIFLFNRDNVLNYDENTNMDKIPENIMYLSFKPYSESEEATTRIFWIDTNINKVHTKFNIHAFDFTTSTAGIHKNKVHLKSLVLHELLHSLGLTHIKTDKHSVMYPYLPLGEERTLLTKQEKDAIVCMYEND